MNSGAGAIGGIFVHEKHFDDLEKGKLKKLDGWWSHEAETRFEMTNCMIYAKGALSYSISNPPILLCACLKASLEVYIFIIIIQPMSFLHGISKFIFKDIRSN